MAKDRARPSRRIPLWGWLVLWTFIAASAVVIGLLIHALITTAAPNNLSSRAGVVGGYAAMLFVLVFATVTIFVRAAEQRTSARIARAKADPQMLLRERVHEVITAFAAATTLMDDLRRDLEAQQAAREALITQAEEQQRLLEVNQEQAEKIRQILVGETKASIREERRQQWMFFGLGALVSIPIGVMINIFVP